MDHPVLLTLAALAGAVTGYAATAAYHRRRNRRRDRHRAVTERLIRAGDTHHVNILRAQLDRQRAEKDVLTDANDTVDAAYTRLTRSQEGGTTP